MPVQKRGHEKQQFTRPIDDEVLKRDERMNSSILLFVSIGNNARVSVSLRLYSLGLYDRVFVVKEKKKKMGYERFPMYIHPYITDRSISSSMVFLIHI